MVTLQLKSNTGTYMLTFKNSLNLIIGDSSTGKTELVRELHRFQDRIVSNANRVLSFINRSSDADVNDLVIIDMDELGDPNLIDDIVRANRSSVCWVFLGRKYSRRLPIAIENTFKLYRAHGVTKNIPFCEKMSNEAPYTKVLTEDSKSGNIFIRDALKMNVGTTNSASGMIKKNAMQHDQLCVFDSLGFGGYIEDFLRQSRGIVPYVAWPSFEGFLLKYLFKDEVPYDAFNAEVAAVEKLKKYIPGYAKSVGCCSSACIKCSNDCKNEARDIIANSEYAWILEKYQTIPQAFLSAADSLN